MTTKNVGRGRSAAAARLEREARGPVVENLEARALLAAPEVLGSFYFTAEPQTSAFVGERMAVDGDWAVFGARLDDNVNGGRGQVPQWLELDGPGRKGTVRGLPLREDIQIPVTEQLIVELYSK